MTGNQFMVRWNEHLSNFSDMFIMLRDEAEFVDCSLACEDGILDAHRLVLAGCSSYLRQLFARAANPHPIIFLTNTRKSIVLLLLEFIYRGQAYVPEDKLNDLMKLGKSLKIKGLNKVLDGTEQYCEIGGCSSPEKSLNNSVESIEEDTQDSITSQPLKSSVTDNGLMENISGYLNIRMGSMSGGYTSSTPKRPNDVTDVNPENEDIKTNVKRLRSNQKKVSNNIKKGETSHKLPFVKNRKGKFAGKGFKIRFRTKKLRKPDQNGMEESSDHDAGNVDDNKNLSIMYRISALETHIIGAYCALHGMKKADQFARMQHKRVIRPKTINKYMAIYLKLSNYRKKKVEAAMRSCGLLQESEAVLPSGNL